MTKAKVLLVEDDPVQAEATEEILLKAGYEVLRAEDGVKAIKMAKTANPDIILLDVVLPGMDGYEVCRWLKLNESTKGIPVIMLSVRKELAEKISGLQIGADDYLPKPYNELELSARIYASLRTKGLQDELRAKNRQLEDLLRQVETMAITDALTGLYNRRKFGDVLSEEFRRSKRYSAPFSIMLLDIDHFKKVNDSYGHQTGDKVLEELARILMENTRDVDTVSRFGGEEFIVVLPNTEMRGAVIVAERIRISVEQHKFHDVEGRITVSIGVCGIPDEQIENEDQMLKCADFALYGAKKNGRNRTETATSLDFKKVH